MPLTTTPSSALQSIWTLGQMPEQALPYAHLIGADPVLQSSFAIGAAAQVSVAAAALAACELGHARGLARQQVAVDMTHAAVECSGWFSVNGVVPDLWEKFSGLYPCVDGWVRIHANFSHHRDGALQLLGLSADTAEKEDVRAALRSWRAQAFEQAAAERGLVVSAQWVGARWPPMVPISCWSTRRICPILIPSLTPAVASCLRRWTCAVPTDNAR